MKRTIQLLFPTMRIRNPPILTIIALAKRVSQLCANLWACVAPPWPAPLVDIG